MFFRNRRIFRNRKAKNKVKQTRRTDCCSSKKQHVNNTAAYIVLQTSSGIHYIRVSSLCIKHIQFNTDDCFYTNRTLKVECTIYLSITRSISSWNIFNKV